MNGIVASEPAGMVDATLQLGFNYADLDLETRIVVQQRTTEIRAISRRMAQDAFDLGVKFAEVKALLGHGYWLPWLRSEGWSADTAGNFMRVARKFRDYRNLDRFAVSALVELSAPSTPEPARLEAISRASTGETITHAVAKKIVAEHKPVTPRTVNEYRAVVNVEDAWGHVETVRPLPLPAWVDDGEELDDADPDAPDEDIEATAEILAETGLVYGRNSDDAFTVRSFMVDGTSPSMKVHYSSETPEHYTPREIIDLAIAVMGGIDLDPCSNSHETPNVPATNHFTQADDGLTQYWEGRVYMNPPYGREIGAWVRKLVESHADGVGGVTEWIALVPGRVDTEWWQTLTEACSFVCFVDGRLTFVGNDGPAPFPSAVVYAGHNFDRFYYTFREIGYIWKIVNPQTDFGA